MVFDVRVIGAPDYIDLVRDSRGRDAASALNTKLDSAREALLTKLGPDRKREVTEFFRQRGEAVSHVNFERYGFLGPLQEWAKNRCANKSDEGFDAIFPHLAALGCDDAMIVPLDFLAPVLVPIKGRQRAYPVCSAPHMLGELEVANTVLKVERSFKQPRIPDFIKASRLKLADMERNEGLDEAFWAKFGLVVLRQLAQRSLDAQLPIFFAERAVVPVA